MRGSSSSSLQRPGTFITDPRLKSVDTSPPGIPVVRRGKDGAMGWWWSKGKSGGEGTPEVPEGLPTPGETEAEPRSEEIDPERLRAAVLRAWESRPVEERRWALGVLLDQ